MSAINTQIISHINEREGILGHKGIMTEILRWKTLPEYIMNICMSFEHLLEQIIIQRTTNVREKIQFCIMKEWSEESIIIPL